ncbi:MAG: hypothetical protein Q4F12_03795 [Erysipelotrichaceae bacterium]|nr:hypothetical protein [Erysipelotrichaceae bacterium]
MGNTLKQVYASLFIDENELQIVVGEYFNTRFNIIRTDKVKMDGILDFKINDYDRVVEVISKSIEHTSTKIGASIKKVILVLPAVNFTRYPLRVSVVPNGGILSKKDIAKAISSSLKAKVDVNSMIVNAAVVKYYVNGIATRRLPEKEICDEVLVDIDLLCADKSLCYEYVKAVSDAGLEVLDITLNNYSICKEAVLLEQSLNSNTILLDIGNEHTFMSLLSKGKLVSTEIIYDGLSNLSNAVYNKFHLPKENIDRLVKFNVDYETNYKDDSVFAWNDDNQVNHSITVSELSECVKEPLNSYLDKLLTMCKPIIDSGPTSFFVVGEGSKMETLVNELKDKSGCDVRNYYPDTIGVRDASLCAAFGSFFVYKEKAMLNELNVSCVDIAEYDQTVDQKKVDIEGESITTKIKKMFELYRDEEV